MAAGISYPSRHEQITIGNEARVRPNPAEPGAPSSQAATDALRSGRRTANQLNQINPNQTNPSSFAAQMKSFKLRPPTVCVQNVTLHVLYETSRSG
jgi:hypothetical protein